MRTTLFLFHPQYTQSLANKKIVDGISTLYPELQFHHVDSHYQSDKGIDVESEQSMLIESDTIIFQFPCYWYSIPSTMKLWLDSVMVYQFAFGDKGDKLRGKNFIISVTVGAEKATYGYNQRNAAPLSDYYLFLFQIGKLSQMECKGFIDSYGYSHTAPHEYIEEQTRDHANRLYHLIN